jgi:hypothetical protein
MYVSIYKRVKNGYDLSGYRRVASIGNCSMDWSYDYTPI